MSMSFAKPMMVLRGVRSAWLMREGSGIGLARARCLAVRLLQLDRAAVREIDRLRQQRSHGADAEIAPALDDREAAGERPGKRSAPSPFDRHRAIDDHRLARQQRSDRPAVWTSNQSGCENWR
jgi:hypothetical protein